MFRRINQSFNPIAAHVNLQLLVEHANLLTRPVIDLILNTIPDGGKLAPAICSALFMELTSPDKISGSDGVLRRLIAQNVDAIGDERLTTALSQHESIDELLRVLTEPNVSRDELYRRLAILYQGDPGILRIRLPDLFEVITTGSRFDAGVYVLQTLTDPVARDLINVWKTGLGTPLSEVFASWGYGWYETFGIPDRLRRRIFQILTDHWESLPRRQRRNWSKAVMDCLPQDYKLRWKERFIDREGPEYDSVRGSRKRDG
jgi:hypothetical protein